MKIVKKGNHYPFCKGMYPIVNKTIVFKKEIVFTDESIFLFPNDDIYDWSKLFGFSFGHHQKNESYRWGFRFTESDKVDVTEYMYVDGKRKTGNLTKLELNKKYIFSINFDKEQLKVYYTIRYNSRDIYNSVYDVENFKWCGYTLGLYIGGNNPAPNKIKIEM